MERVGTQGTTRKKAKLYVRGLLETHSRKHTEASVCCAFSQMFKCRGRCLETIQMKMHVGKELEALFLDKNNCGIKVL